MMRPTRPPVKGNAAGSHLGATERAFTFIAPAGFPHPKTRAQARLLGPCFKTGRMKPYDRQRPERVNMSDISPPATARGSGALHAVHRGRRPTGDGKH